jgi:predicted metal-dependent peptidase
MRPNPRYIAQGIYLPSLSSRDIGTIAVAIDTSGSVSETQLEQFSAEVSAMLEEFNTTVEVIYVDSKVQGQETFNQADLPLTLKLKGGGGTDFRPAFELMETQGIMPCCLVYLTDMCCDRFPGHAPEYPVLWVNTEGDYGWKDPPFGRVIALEK